MATSPNRLSQFLKEIKRRNVHRLMAVYGGTAFVIFEASTMIFPRWGLPDWTIDLVLYLLIFGAIITFILGWVYDIHPEGGIVKTKPADNIEAEDSPKSSNSWKVASYISFVVIVGLIVLNIIPRSGKKEMLDKSIAVLPFINDSQEQENEHFINGIMEELLINLQSIKELRVPGRTSTEQYRSNPKSIPEIASEMNVAYIVDASGQRYGNNIRLRVQLLEGATDRQIWADSYDEVINGPEDIFRIQSEIAQAIAAELQAVITPYEKELIEQIPTTSLTALDFYQEARDNYWKYWVHGDSLPLQRAEDLYKKALNNDPTFAQAYNGLASVYMAKQRSAEYLTESYLDSVLRLTDIALSHDRNISETYVIRGQYYSAINNPDQAITEFGKALNINPNEWKAYAGLATLYSNIDNLKAIENLHHAISLNNGKELSYLLGTLSWAYFVNGIEKQGMKYAQQYVELTADSAAYYTAVAGALSAEDEKRIEVYRRVYDLDSSNPSVIFELAKEYSMHGYYEESLKYFRKFLSMGGFYENGLHRIGYALWMNGLKEEAQHYFDQQIEYSTGAIELGRRYAGTYYPYYDIAAVYSFRGEKDKALEYLKIFSSKELIPYWFIELIRIDPLLDNIRDEAEYQQIYSELEAKYQAEHERVRQWLEENNML